MNILKRISKQQENLPNFIGIYGDCDTFHVPRIWFVMELCSLGPITRLLKYIQQKNQINKREKEKLIAYSIKNALKALEYLHGSGIMHRGTYQIEFFQEIHFHLLDVKGSHILVTENYTIKLIDFGVAGLFNNEQPKRNSSVGTSLWMAPVSHSCFFFLSS